MSELQDPTRPFYRSVAVHSTSALDKGCVAYISVTGVDPTQAGHEHIAVVQHCQRSMKSDTEVEGYGSCIYGDRLSSPFHQPREVVT